MSTESSQLTVLWEGEREQSRCHPRRDSDQKLRRPSCTPQVGGWLSLGCVWRGWLTQPLFWLDHGFGLGKHFVKLISRNEAELTIWCLKTLVIAKSEQSLSPPHWTEELWLVPQWVQQRWERLALASLMCCLDKDLGHPRPLLTHCSEPKDQQNFRPNFRLTWVCVWWWASTYMCLSLFRCLRRCCLSWQIHLLKAKLVTGKITDFTHTHTQNGSAAKGERGRGVYSI